MYQAEVVEVTFTDAARNSDKFYRCYRIWDNDDPQEHRVVFQWGRRGAKGQHQNQVFANEGQADVAIIRKLSEKESKGYRRSYDKTLPGVSDDILEMAGINRFATKTVPESADPFVRIALDTDRCRRLAMGDQADFVQAVTIRSSLKEQLETLRTSVLVAEGQFEIVDMLLAAKV